MDVVVQKYGGSSLSTIDRVHHVARLTAEVRRSGRPTVVVVSARGQTTDELCRLAGQVGGDAASERAARECDQLLATGECASAALLALALDRLGVPAVSLTGQQAGILVAGRHRTGVIATIDTGRIMRSLHHGDVVVVGGFHGVNADGDTVTLGRGGSDTSAVALAAALDARACEIYSDVGGVYTADPRIVPGARVLPVVDVGVMAEMAFSGARVLHARAVELAALHNVVLRVGSSFDRDLGSVIPKGSVIPEGGRSMESEGAVLAVTHDVDVARILLLTGDGADPSLRVLEVLAALAVPADQVACFADRGRFGICLTVGRHSAPEVRQALEGCFGSDLRSITVDEDVAKVSIVGMGLLDRPEYGKRMMCSLENAGIPASDFSLSQLRASVLVPRSRFVEAVAVVHETFRLGEPQPRAPHNGRILTRNSP